MPAKLTLPVFAGALAFASGAAAQTLGPSFATDYTIAALPTLPGVPLNVTGLTFKYGDPTKLLISGAAGTAGAAIYELTVTRDAAGHVNGYSGSAVVHATAPDADGGLQFESTGVLLYTTWPTNTLGQIKLGSSSPDKIIQLTPLGVSVTTGGLAVTPVGFPAAGKLRITTYSGANWYSADLVPDGLGTYDLANVMLIAALPGTACALYPSATPEAVVYVDSSYPGFATQQVLVCNWDCSSVGAYAIDAQGDIDVLAPRREFLSGYVSAGAAIDPVTGDFLFADYFLGNSIVVKPTTAFGAGCGGLLLDSNLARLGSNLYLSTTNYPAGSGLGLQAISFTQFLPGVSLSSFGLTGCFQHTGTEATVLLVPTGGASSFQVAIPNNPAFLGVLLTSQTYALAPGANPANAISSNGIATVVGY